MKLRVLFVALTIFGLGALSAIASSIQWRDVDTGMAEGKRSHKYILADVYTSWCGWCKRLDRDTFTNEGLSQYLGQKFVCIKANAEDNSSGAKLAHQYAVDGYPCALVFNADGKLIGRIVGYKDAANYQSTLDNIISNPQ